MGGKGKFIDLTGMKFGRLTVLFQVASSKSHGSRWKCRCDCGKEVAVKGENLRRGATKSCGCYRREFTGEKSRIEDGLASKRSIYRIYIDSAKRRKLPFELSFEQFINLTQQNCHYCNAELENFHLNHGSISGFSYNGIDRKDNTKGYTLENSLPCCTNCNKAKGTMSYDEFISWGKKLGNHLNRDILVNPLPHIFPVTPKYRSVVLESEYNGSRNICSN